MVPFPCACSEDENLVAAAFMIDNNRGKDLGAFGFGSNLPSSPEKARTSENSMLPSLWVAVSIRRRSPGATRYCLPPVRMTAYIAKTSAQRGGERLLSQPTANGASSQECCIRLACRTCDPKGPSEPASPATGWTGYSPNLRRIVLPGSGSTALGLSRALPVSKNSQRKPEYWV